MIQKNIFPILIFFTALIMGTIFYYNIDVPRTAARQIMHIDFINNNPQGAFNAGNNSNYRILAPFSVDLLIRFFHQFISYQRAFLLAFGIFNITAIFFSLYSCFRYLLIWFDKHKALNILFFASILWIFTFKNQTYHPWSLIEFGFFSLGLIYIYNKRILPLILILILATLNRNTSVFLISAFFFANFPFSSNLRDYKKFFIELGLLFLVYFVVMRLLSVWRAFPYNSNLWDVIQNTLKGNLEMRNLVESVINICIFSAPIIFLTSLNFQAKPQYLKRLALVVLIYLPFFFAFMRWLEIRGLVILFPFLLPLVFLPDNREARSPTVQSLV